MLVRSLTLTAVFLAVPLAAFADNPDKKDDKTVAASDHPFKNAEKGQWVSYKMAMKVGGNEISNSVKQTVVEKTDKSVTIEIVLNFFGQEQKHKQTIDLTKPFDPVSATGMPKQPGADVKFDKVENGKETITIDGKKYESEWVKGKVKLSQNGMDVEGDMKFWISKSVPVGGLAKMEMKMNAGGMDVEINMTLDKSGKN